jgi:hypothetical protein
MLQKFTVSMCMVLLLSFCGQNILAQVKNNISFSEKNTANAFPLFSNVSIPSFYYDANDAKVVQIAAEAFANDVKLISDKEIKLNTSNKVTGEFAIITGTIGQSKLIDDLIKNKAIDISNIQNKWECFTIQVVKNKLLIIGSDRRGTAFGIFHLSRLMGVSPFVYWADVMPTKKQQLFVTGAYTSNEPSVQYRGIFINDEDWGLQPWAAKNMDTDIKDIGPKTYAKVFELLLRLKANYIWPAMHPCTKAFYYYKENPKVADDYAIVVGGSHCEPMLRNNVCEWAETYEAEYKKKPGEWRYDVNKNEIYNYWNDRIKEAVNYESVFTVGMRGVHDGSMPGPKDPNEKVKLLENVITDQREILQNNFKKSSATIPQIFVPYKEVLSLYRRGMKLPDDVTIIWPDDNHGYIRQLPNEEEQKRSGGHGVYYHLSYWGAPHDYLWLSSTSPALIGYEMKKAYDYGAKKLWVFNVGDIKPAELETQFALDMAYDIHVYDEKNPAEYITNWARDIFGKNVGKKITTIKEKYYQLAQLGKPEHLGMINFNQHDAKHRIKDYQLLAASVLEVEKSIPVDLKNAFFQLVKYPTISAKWMNEKIAYTKIAQFYVNRNRMEDAKKYATQAKMFYDSIVVSTNYYNTILAKGKWNGIMSFHPRDLKVFDAPKSFDSLKITNDSILLNLALLQDNLLHSYSAKEIYEKKMFRNCTLLIGIGGLIVKSTSKDAQLNLPLNLQEGNYTIVVKCLPTYAMEKEKQLNYSIAINDEATQNVNVHAETESAAWKENVIRGFSQGTTKHTITTNATHTIKIELKNKNLVINKIEIYKSL